VLTPPTGARISTRGVEKAVDGVCYPVKVSYGHIEQLAGKTKFLFIPSLIKMPTPKPSETGFYCPMVQSNSYMVRMAFGLDRASILNPVINLKHDPATLAVEIYRQMGARLGISKKLIKKSLHHAIDRQPRTCSNREAKSFGNWIPLNPSWWLAVVPIIFTTTD
jgi:predicted nucleotide-binding protein (sugar kinase/HSP70/actin superfamily)